MYKFKIKYFLVEKLIKLIKDQSRNYKRKFRYTLIKS